MIRLFRSSLLPLFTGLALSAAAHAQSTTLFTNYGQNPAGSYGIVDLSQRVAWDFTTGVDAYEATQLTLQVSNDDGRAHSITAQIFTSSGASQPETLVGTLTVDVTFTEGTFQDFTSNAGSFILNSNTTYWLVASLGESLDGGAPGLLLRRIASSAGDSGSLYTGNGVTSQLLSADGGATWVPDVGTDAPKYLLEGLKAVVTVPPTAVITAQSLQNASFQGATTLLEDFALRLFRARSGQNGGADPNSIVVSLGGEDELVEIGEGDGDEDGDKDPRKVGIKTGGAGQLMIFSSFDYGYGDLTTQAASQRTDTYTGSLGAELRLTDHLAMGAGLGALTARTRVAGGIADVDTEGLSLVTYASYNHSGTYLDLLYAATLLDHSVTRNTGAGSVTASPESTVHSVQFNLGHNFTCGSLIHGPFATLNYAHASTDPYAEMGAGAVSVGRQEADTLLGRVGWQASTQVKRDWGVIIPQVRLSWDNQYLNDANTADVALLGVPGVVTRTGTAGVRQNGLGVGAGIMLRLNNHWAMAVNYQGHVFDKAANLHNITAFVSYRW